MPRSSSERRKYERYDTKVDIYFRVSYEVSTKVKFQVETGRGRLSARKYSAFSKNISVEGLSFVAKKKLLKGDRIHVEMFLPKSKDPIVMEGDVRWCLALTGKKGHQKIFETGLRIFSVKGQPVEKSIYFDKTYRVIWSILLESVLGNFRIISKRLSVQREQ